MENILQTIINAENIRAALLLTAIVCGFIWQNNKFEKRFSAQDKKIDAIDKKIDFVELKLDKKIDEVELKLDKKIDEVELKLDKNINEVEMRLNMKIETVKTEIGAKIDEKIDSFHESLKTNDFAHLGSTIQALTFTLLKNNIINESDKTYVDTRLNG